jgi:hypothetical protein
MITRDRIYSNNGTRKKKGNEKEKRRRYVYVYTTYRNKKAI